MARAFHQTNKKYWYHGPHRQENHQYRAILFYTGRVHKLGETHDGPPLWTDGPRTRAGHYNNSAATIVQRKEIINIIDTPGHVDFNRRGWLPLRVLIALLLCSVPLVALSLNLKQFGVKLKIASLGLLCKQDG